MKWAEFCLEKNERGKYNTTSESIDFQQIPFGNQLFSEVERWAIWERMYEKAVGADFDSLEKANKFYEENEQEVINEIKEEEE